MEKFSMACVRVNERLKWLINSNDPKEKRKVYGLFMGKLKTIEKSCKRLQKMAIKTNGWRNVLRRGK